MPELIKIKYAYCEISLRVLLRSTILGRLVLLTNFFDRPEARFDFVEVSH